ncbi:hemolysin family protein [Candidatus Binatus sp.]|uniref:hemolysin family protein n=1 Tax=Candidatus Binatus sp. TaxID=2811406 RepID=UPI002F955A3E
MMFMLPLAVLALIVLSATLAASETALFSMARLEHTREQMSLLVQHALDRLMRRPLESLIVIIGLNEACNIFADCLATIIALAWLGDKWGPIVAAPAMLAIVLLFCDITPKTFALGFPAAVTWITARPLAALADFVHPFARHFTPLEQAPRPGPVSEAEFKTLLRLGEHQGQVEPAERAMIHRVFDFGARRAAEVMTPRERIFSLDIEMPVAQLVTEIAHENFSRVPVYRHSQDNIVGILHAKDFAARRLEPSPPRVERLLRPAYFVPPGKLLADLFDEMRRGRFQIALVVNEYGRLLGLVTLEDLLEELFGEIRDEFESEIPELTKISDHEWSVSGAIALGKLADALAPARVVEAYGGGKTLSSLVLRRLKRVPRAGEKLRLGEFEATIERVRGATVELVRMHR